MQLPDIFEAAMNPKKVVKHVWRGWFLSVTLEQGLAINGALFRQLDVRFGWSPA